MRRLLFALLSFCILYGCQEPDVVPEPLPPIEIILPPVVSASADTTINYGDSISINWSVKNSVTCNVALVGNRIFRHLLRDTSLFIEATNTAGSIKRTISIKARDFTSSVFGLLTHAPKWKWIASARLNSKKEFLYDVVFSGPILEESYMTNGTVKIYIDGIYKGTNNWTLKDGKILTGNSTLYIISVNERELKMALPIFNSEDYIEKIFTSY